MKKMLIFALAVIMIACNQNGQNSKQTNKIETRQMDKYLTDIFKEKYPNFKNNDLIKEKAFNELMVKIDSLVPLKYLEDIPLEIFKIGKNPHGEGAIVQFYTNNFDIDKSQILSNQLEFEIIGFMSEELASSLNKNKKYFIYGDKYKRLSNTETYAIVNQTYFSPEPEISTDVVYTDIYEYKIGVFLSVIDSVKITK